MSNIPNDNIDFWLKVTFFKRIYREINGNPPFRQRYLENIVLGVRHKPNVMECKRGHIANPDRHRRNIPGLNSGSARYLTLWNILKSREIIFKIIEIWIWFFRGAWWYYITQTTQQTPRRDFYIKQDWKSFQSLPASIILVYCIGSNMG
jgi:hypothetical protein